MKKKWLKYWGIMAVIAVFAALMAGCGSSKNRVVGTWYCDRDDESVLMLKKDNTYTDGTWLTSGDFSVEDDTVILVGMLDGTHILQIQKEEGEIILCHLGSDGTPLRTYYNTAKKAAAVRTARQEAERLAAEEKAAALRKALEESIVGYWCGRLDVKEFGADGTYTEYTADGPQKGSYEILEWNDKFHHVLSITRADGTAMELRPQLQEDETYHLEGYEKAEPLALSVDLLVGEWFYYDAINEKPNAEFYKDGTFTIKSSFPEFVPDTILNYSIEEEQTSQTPNLGTRWAYLSKGETEYHLYLSITKITLGESFTSLNHWVRPIVE